MAAICIGYWKGIEVLNKSYDINVRANCPCMKSPSTKKSVVFLYLVPLAKVFNHLQEKRGHSTFSLSLIDWLRWLWPADKGRQRGATKGTGTR